MVGKPIYKADGPFLFVLIEFCVVAILLRVDTTFFLRMPAHCFPAFVIVRKRTDGVTVCREAVGNQIIKCSRLRQDSGNRSCSAVRENGRITHELPPKMGRMANAILPFFIRFFACLVSNHRSPCIGDSSVSDGRKSPCFLPVPTLWRCRWLHEDSAACPCQRLHRRCGIRTA